MGLIMENKKIKQQMDEEAKDKREKLLAAIAAELPPQGLKMNKKIKQEMDDEAKVFPVVIN